MIAQAQAAQAALQRHTAHRSWPEESMQLAQSPSARSAAAPEEGRLSSSCTSRDAVTRVAAWYIAKHVMNALR